VRGGLEATGERLVEEHYHSSIEDYVVYLMHVATYRFAEPFARGRRVLDYGCGSGYGSRRIAEVASAVHAVDVDEAAVDHARRHFVRANLTYSRVEKGAPLPFPDGAFDTVLSFQVLEHVPADVAHLAEARRVIRPGGCLVLATPDRERRLLPLQKPWNRWHVREYSERTLRRALAGHFDDVEVLRMSGRRDVVDVELRRCRRLKWLTLPVTLPFVPDPLRVWLLGALRALQAARGRPTVRREFDFDESVIQIGPALQPSLNLVATARVPEARLSRARGGEESAL